MNIAEQIKALEATRAAKAARLGEIAKKSIDEGRSMDEAEAEEFDNTELEVQQIDKDLVRLNRLDQLSKQAKPVEKTPTAKAAAASREVGAPALVLNRQPEEKFKGQFYTRMVIARTLAYLSQGEMSAAQIARQRGWDKSHPELFAVIKAGVAGGGSDSGEWGAELVTADGRYTGDFIEFLTSKTVYDKLGLRSVPANVTIKGQDGTATGYWVGQSKGIPVSTADFNNVTLTPLKVAALAVISNELLRDSTPAAEQLVRDALVDASVQRIDTTFLSTTAASAGVSPAGMLNGVSAMVSDGTDAESLGADIKALYGPFLTAKNASGLSFVLNPALAKSIQLMRNALGQREFEGITATGGTLEGDPAVTGDNVNANHLILLKPSDIYRIGEGGIEVSVSREATIEQDSAPQGASDTPVAASATLMSMFQTESTAIKVVRSINFAKRRSHAVQYVNNADYGSATGSPE